MQQTPVAGSFHLRWAGDLFSVSLRLPQAQRGRALLRTNIGGAAIRRTELIAGTESGKPPLARDWHDVPMAEVTPGCFEVRLPLTEVGIFEAKACFFPDASSVPQWPPGDNLRIKVEPAHTAGSNTVYTAFVRQFGAALHHNPRSADLRAQEEALDRLGYTVIPPSGTFRDLIRQLDTIMVAMRFRIVQLLPVHPVPVAFGRMGRYGSAFAALDFLAVDPALAQFDTRATPLDQFRELIDAVHARGGALYMDLPANHTGWAATLQTHHPDWYRRHDDGQFISPGAWGVVWADLVELDFTDPHLRAYMAEVFLFWCRQGVDGFRCDAGYMIPSATWSYIVARVRMEYPDTVFLLEGLGGKVETTQALLTDSNLNWAYSELFQTDDRGAFDWYLPRAIELSERCGPLIHFAETHDNNRLAKRGQSYARMRVALSALLSHQGAFGITNGVEWFATEKVDVHGASALNWGAHANQVAHLELLNRLLDTLPAFAPNTQLKILTANAGPVLAVKRVRPNRAEELLILVNLDCEHEQSVTWPAAEFETAVAWDLMSGEALVLKDNPHLRLASGRVCCLTANPNDLQTLEDAKKARVVEPTHLALRRRNLMALRVRQALEKGSPPKGTAHGAGDGHAATLAATPSELGAAMVAAPLAFCALDPTAMPRCTLWQWPDDQRRHVMVPYNNLLLVRAPHPFRVELKSGAATHLVERAVKFDDGAWGAFLIVDPCAVGATGEVGASERRTLVTTAFTPTGSQRLSATLLLLPAPGTVRATTIVDGVTVRADECAQLCAVLSNGAGAMTQARAAWGTLRSQYDALLAVNLDPHVPADKMIFWTRARIWLRYRGYSHEINASCLESFGVDPAGRYAEWLFNAPSGMGRSVRLRLCVELEWEANCAKLTIERLANHSIAKGCTAAAESLPDDDAVTIIVRPDIEWRSFHEKTKAFTGPERRWPVAIEAQERGFLFRPTDTVALSMAAAWHGKRRRSVGGAAAAVAFTHEPEWLYMVDHPEERERGLEAHSDLFSPGWFQLHLRGAECASLMAHECSSGASVPTADCRSLPPLKPHYPLPELLRHSLDLYIVRRDALKTVIAGYPWFLDWGRDTLIALRGIIAAGRTTEALEILREFGRYEESGTLPNIIHGNTVGNRDTSDAPLWFCVAAGDLMEVIGPTAVLEAPCGKRKLSEVIVSILCHYRDGTPNHIKMDPASALIYSPSHFTWMDTNYPACTPRMGYPVEVQALWIAGLRLAARRIDAVWMELAERATQSLVQHFVTPEGWLADCLRATADTPAARATMEDVVRPNQLLALTLKVPLPSATRRAILRACESLLVPGAIRSLADRPIRPELAMYPYGGHYLGDEDTQRKPTYHNGTAWSWPFPLYAEGLLEVYGVSARAAALSLLESASEVISGGALGHIPEICDGDAPHTPRGCRAQAWGVSELLRVLAIAVPTPIGE